LVLPIIAYSLSSAKLDIRAKQFLPGRKGVGGRGGVGLLRGGGKGGEMSQTLYVNMNKILKICFIIQFLQSGKLSIVLTTRIVEEPIKTT
jgi:hypothetical protein